MDKITPHGIFCNRTLRLRRIQAIDYDMDYTFAYHHMVPGNAPGNHLKERLNCEPSSIASEAFA